VEGNVTNAFGKLRADRDGRLTDWHPLVDHLTDVAACFERLCACRSVRRALECVAGRALCNQDIARLTVLVFLHDLGKANGGFQAKRWPAHTAPREWPEPAGHCKEAMDLFTEKLAHLLPADLIDSLDTWGEGVFALLAAVIGHHGRPIPADHSSPNRSVWQPVKKPDGTLVYDPAAVLRDIGDQARGLFPGAFIPGSAPLPDAPAFGHLLAGLVQLADWIGSDTDTSGQTRRR
jgi:CRISPR-associated endonuclease/helicase Cas3